MLKKVGKRFQRKTDDVGIGALPRLDQEGTFSLVDGDNICPDGTPKVVIGEGP